MIGGYHTFAQQTDLQVGFDFSYHSGSNDFYTSLDGQWYFFEKELLTPNVAKAQISHGMGEVVSLPNSFQAQMGGLTHLEHIPQQLKSLKNI